MILRSVHAHHVVSAPSPHAAARCAAVNVAYVDFSTGGMRVKGGLPRTGLFKVAEAAAVKMQPPLPQCPSRRSARSSHFTLKQFSLWGSKGFCR